MCILHWGPVKTVFGRQYVLGYSVLRGVVVSMNIFNKLPHVQKGVETSLTCMKVGGMRLTSLVINLFQNMAAETWDKYKNCQNTIPPYILQKHGYLGVL